MKEKDIYEILNNIDVEIPTEEIPLSEVEVKRIKKNIRDKVFNNKRKYLIVAIIFLSFIFAISPLGKDVIAMLKEKLVFNPSYGIISLEEDKDLYTLKDPFTVSINNNNMLVKSIVNNGEELFIQIIGDVYSIEAKEITSNIAVKLNNEEIKNCDSYGIHTGGGKAVIEIGIDMRGIKAEDLVLMYKDIELKKVTLEKPDYKYDYNEIGGNSTNKEILIGGTSYYIEGKRYFKLWSDTSSLISKGYNVNVGGINIKEITDEKGNFLNFESSNEGSGREYKILDNYNGKINITVDEVDLQYDLNTPTRITFKDPKKNGDYTLDKELTFAGIEDKISITEIKKEKNDVVVCVNLLNNNSNDRLIYLIMDSSRTGSSMSDREKMIGEIDIDYKDLSIYEKLTGNIKMNIDKLDVLQKGSWEFTIE
ncbi:hypothetical protein [uncultured Clostridium sp.]|uniref:hypothetical protein n=1 Tax=uncultured Clostridium sp. TaxID=59620 RepID=UPI00258AAC4E|nr:hypothetical protein [uncultured Clostridium sp.]